MIVIHSMKMLLLHQSIWANSDIELDLPWSKECIISRICKTPEVSADPDANPPNPVIQAKASEKEMSKQRFSWQHWYRCQP